VTLDDRLLDDLSARAGADRWGLSVERFGEALLRSASSAFKGQVPDAHALERYLRGLHLDDLALACACEDGHEPAWEHFVHEFRPQLYRAAAAIDSTGEGRELADGLYAELFGLRERDGARQSLFRYFHGRSRLGTWLRAVLSQRHVDMVRARRRERPLPEEPDQHPATSESHDGSNHGLASLLMVALAGVLAGLAARDRLRLACYHAQGLTLAQIGRLTGEHEATVSRHLTRTRREVRLEVERRLRSEHGMGETEVAECLHAALAGAGEFDIGVVLESDAARKLGAADRSR